MRKYRLTPAAQRDLSSIWNYTEARWNANQAETYIGEIRAAIERVATDPDRGRDSSDIRAGYRHYKVGSHLVFYIETECTIDVIRIVHQRMDPSRHI